MINLKDSESDIDENSLTFDNKSEFVCLKQFNQQLATKYTFLNEDMNLFGPYRVVEHINGELRLNLNATVESVEQLLRIYKEKLKLLEESDDKVRFTESEILRLKKLLSRKSQEYETMATECARVKDTLQDARVELKAANKQLSNERNNIKNLNSNITRERNQFKTDKTKIEREMILLKERMNKLLSDPKKAYSSIEINQSEILSNSVKSIKKSNLSEERYENQINDELIGSYKVQVEDVVLENRQLKEHLVNCLIQLKQITNDQRNILSNKLEQSNNNGSSANSSCSDISIKSNETFIVSHKTTDLDERLYLDMPFEVIKDDMSSLFDEYYEAITNRLKVRKLHEKTSNSLVNDICTCVELIDSAPSENISRLQKEIFQLRRQLIDYESIIQGKDSLLEVAIEQRIRRGSLLPNDSSLSSN